MGLGVDGAPVLMRGVVNRRKETAFSILFMIYIISAELCLVCMFVCIYVYTIFISDDPFFFL